jgi:hypothetical protein
MSRTSVQVSFGFAESSKAPVPATIAVAQDVPLKPRLDQAGPPITVVREGYAFRNGETSRCSASGTCLICVNSHVLCA